MALPGTGGRGGVDPGGPEDRGGPGVETSECDMVGGGLAALVLEAAVAFVGLGGGPPEGPLCGGRADRPADAPNEGGRRAGGARAGTSFNTLLIRRVFSFFTTVKNADPILVARG